MSIKFTSLTGLVGFGSIAPVPPVAPTDPDIDNVVLLAGFNGADGAVVFSDESPAQQGAFTFVNQAQLDTAQMKFGSASLLLDGADDTVSLPDTADWNMGAGQFTMEAHVRFASDTGTRQALMSQWDAANQAFLFDVDLTLGEIRFIYTTNGSTAIIKVASVALSVNTWYHIAVDRDASNDLRIYLNGAVIGGTTAAAATFFNSTDVLRVGAALPEIVSELDGWIDEVRITKGVARYAGAFTPPTAAFPRPVGDPDFASVVALASFDGADGSTTFSDESPAAHGAFNFIQQAQLDTAQKQFGTASLLVDGVSDAATLPHSADWGLGTGEFTMEAWVRLNTLASTQTVLAHWGGSSSRSWHLSVRPGLSTMRFLYSTSGSNFFDISGAFTWVVNTWYHVAADRDSGGDLRLYVDGVVIGGPTALPGLANPSVIMSVGANNVTDNELNGWIDEIRITKGVARYAGTFTRPAAAFPRF